MRYIAAERTIATCSIQRQVLWSPFWQRERWKIII
jgi:hypothetical protein